MCLCVCVGVWLGEVEKSRRVDTTFPSGDHNQNSEMTYRDVLEFVVFERGLEKCILTVTGIELADS